MGKNYSVNGSLDVYKKPKKAKSGETLRGGRDVSLSCLCIVLLGIVLVGGIIIYTEFLSPVNSNINGTESENNYQLYPSVVGLNTWDDQDLSTDGIVVVSEKLTELENQQLEYRYEASLSLQIVNSENGYDKIKLLDKREVSNAYYINQIALNNLVYNLKVSFDLKIDGIMYYENDMSVWFIDEFEYELSPINDLNTIDITMDLTILI